MSATYLEAESGLIGKPFAESESIGGTPLARKAHLVSLVLTAMAWTVLVLGGIGAAAIITYEVTQSPKEFALNLAYVVPGFLVAVFVWAVVSLLAVVAKSLSNREGGAGPGIPINAKRFVIVALVIVCLGVALSAALQKQTHTGFFEPVNCDRNTFDSIQELEACGFGHD